jgi:hypothetical protein
MQVRKSWWKDEEETLNEEEKNCTGLEVDGFERKNPFVRENQCKKVSTPCGAI